MPTAKPARANKFREEFYVRTYQLARQGLGKNTVAKALGVSRPTLDHWFAVRPSLLKAYQDGRHDGGKSSKADAFSDYVARRLPPKLQKLWTALDRWNRPDADPHRSAVRVERLLSGQGKQVRQHLWVHAYVCSNFNKSEACRRTNTPPRTVDEWAASDPGFAELIDKHLVEAKRDFIEGALMDLVNARETPAVIFAAKTMLKDRGYGTEVKVQHGGAVGHYGMSINQVIEKLPLAERVKVLDAMQQSMEPHALAEHVEDAEYEVKEK